MRKISETTAAGANDETAIGQTTVFTFREIIFLLVFAMAAIIATGLLFFPKTLEDSFITFRYSQHLAEGYGLGAWNMTGERVEGYTSLLWMVVLGLGNFAGLNIIVFSKVLGFLSHLLVSMLLIAFPLLPKRSDLRREDILGDQNSAVLAGVFLSLYLPLSYYAASGMETVFFSMLVLLLFLALFLSWSSFIVPAVVALLVFTRPEGVLVAAIGILLGRLKENRYGVPLFNMPLTIGVFLAAVAVLVAYRLVLFGDILPNTYWAKAGGSAFQHVPLGISYILSWVKHHIAIMLLFAVSVFYLAIDFRKKRLVPAGSLFVLLLLLTFIVYITKVGGDNYSAFPYWRHFVHLMPLIVVMCCYSLRKINRYLALVVIVALTFPINYMLLNVHGGIIKTAVKEAFRTYPNLTLSPHNPYYAWLKDISRKDTVIASSLGGELPYVVDADHIDILGLNTSEIAKNGSFDPAGPQDSKTDMDWVLSKQPDIIEAYFSAKQIINGTSAKAIISYGRYKMNYELISSSYFQDNYLFIANAPYDDLDRALFIKKSYLAGHTKKDQLECLPLKETTLSSYHPFGKRL